ncbi:MAG: single-stranded DNA-binding protein [Chloroflexi bacterium]|nr:single-stranded DNA-binding protein [Chloroflexota bacterium]
MNKIMLIGNLGRDPEMSYTPNGTALTKFTLAVNRYTKSPSGERQTETEWFNIVAWSQLAETCNTWLKKGQKVFVEGRIQQRKYTDREGVQRMAVDVIINDMEMLTPKDRQSGSGSDSFLGGGDELGDLDEHPF